MSFFKTIENDFSAVVHWFGDSEIAHEIESDFHAAVAELSAIAADDVKNAVKVIGLAALGGLATGGTAGAIAAGINAAENEFVTLGHQISRQTINTLVTTVVNAVHSNVTPAPVVAPVSGA